MRRLLYCIAGAVMLGSLTACDDEAWNPGDFSLKATLELGTITSAKGRVYPLVVDEVKDTVYEYFYTVRDTLKNNAGEPARDENGDLVIDIREESYFSKKTARLVRMRQVVLFNQADTLTIPVKSNARWSAPMPVFTLNGKAQTPWFENYGSTLAGGGDSHVKLAVATARSKRVFQGCQRVLTSDSLIMYIVPFTQVGRGQTPDGYDFSLEGRGE